jgi:DNA helicase-2/ATP-dependent DNA helicase PcrA
VIRENKKQLNDRQQAVVNYGSGPLLIVAGAGTGKTTVLISRLAHLILDEKLGTDQVLLLTLLHTINLCQISMCILVMC